MQLAKTNSGTPSEGHGGKMGSGGLDKHLKIVLLENWESKIGSSLVDRHSVMNIIHNNYINKININII